MTIFKKIIITNVILFLLGYALSTTILFSYSLRERDKEIKDLKTELELINNFYNQEIPNGRIR